MFIYKYNAYTGKYYTYDTDFYDIFTPMFDETIHPSDDDFDVNPREYPEYRMKCAFCNTIFETRNQLFKHLGYMGINIHKASSESYTAMDDSMGDYGMTIVSSRKPARRRHKYQQPALYHRKNQNSRLIYKKSNKHAAQLAEQLKTSCAL